MLTRAVAMGKSAFLHAIAYDMAAVINCTSTFNETELGCAGPCAYLPCGTARWVFWHSSLSVFAR